MHHQRTWSLDWLPMALVLHDPERLGWQGLLLLSFCPSKPCLGTQVASQILFCRFGCFRDGIIEEQKAYQRREQREDRSMYGPYLAQLPADMLAVITMHRLMGLLMSDMDNGSVKVVHAAIQIGEAVEQEVSWAWLCKVSLHFCLDLFSKSTKSFTEWWLVGQHCNGVQVRIHQLMKKKKKHMELKTGGTERSLLSDKGDEVITGQNVDITSDSIREKVKKLVKQNKLRRVDSILRHASTDEPWTAAIHVKVWIILGSADIPPVVRI